MVEEYFILLEKKNKKILTSEDIELGFELFKTHRFKNEESLKTPALMYS